jgi:metallo-beta-lactamase family protein
MARNESIDINSMSEPCIILAGSGMCTAGRIKHHIANNVEDEKNTLLFVGFQVEGTLGSIIKGGAKKINLLGKEVSVNAKVESIEGFSAHADRNGLMEWLGSYSEKPKVFIIHGEENQQGALAERLKKDGYECVIPSLNEKIEL